VLEDVHQQDMVVLAADPVEGRGVADVAADEALRGAAQAGLDAGIDVAGDDGAPEPAREPGRTQASALTRGSFGSPASMEAA
jgi:hypothetical protein